MKLTEFALNQNGVILAITENAVSDRLAEFGIYPGAGFLIIKKASFNGPLFLQVGDSRIALRRTEAEDILVE